jgi:hypothetical protein
MLLNISKAKEMLPDAMSTAHGTHFKVNMSVHDFKKAWKKVQVIKPASGGCEAGCFIQLGENELFAWNYKHTGDSKQDMSYVFSIDQVTQKIVGCFFGEIQGNFNYGDISVLIDMEEYHTF